MFGVEPEAGNDYYLSRKAGKRVSIPQPDTIADGLRAPKPGVITFPIIESLVEDILLVSDDEIRATMELLRSRMKIVVEPSGAVGAAACLFHKLPADVRSVGIIISAAICKFLGVWVLAGSSKGRIRSARFIQSTVRLPFEFLGFRRL